MTCKFMPQIHATHVCTICYAYVCVFTLSRRLRFMRDFVIVDKIQRNMRWHLDFVPWERETFSSGSQCTFRHDETWTKYAYNCVCGWRCAWVCVRVLTHLTNVLKTNSVSFTVDGKSLFKTRRFSHAYFMFVSYRFGLFRRRGRGRETNHKHVKSIRVK